MGLVACTGMVDGPLGPSSSERSTTGTPSVVGPGGSPSSGQGVVAGSSKESALITCTERSVGAAPLRRLTRAQYAHTIEDLLALTPDVSGFPADDSTGGYEVALGMSSLLVESYGDAAEQLAKQAELKRLLPCEVASGDDACAKSFIARFSRRAFRRASSEEEQARLFAVYSAGRASTFEAGVRLVLQAVLMSPSFVYHVEPRAGRDQSGLDKLASFALANRLSYLLWSSAPDDALLLAAEQGELESEAGLLAEAERMMSARPEATQRGFREFYRQWLGFDQLEALERDRTRYPEFTPALGAALRDSLSRQIDALAFEQHGTLADLLSSDHAYVNRALAPLFGVSTPSDELSRVSLDGAQRKGLLTHPALLTALAKPNQSDPVLRGKFVRERLLCQPLPPPPPNVAVVPPDPAPGLSTRARFAEHSANAACAGCHKLMDPIGFGLEHYDALGRYRTLDEGIAVDAAGEIVATDDANGKFVGGPALSAQLASSRQVHDCVATQFFRFALGRSESAADRCSIAHTAQRFGDAGGTLAELLLSVVKSDAFRFRAVSEVP